MTNNYDIVDYARTWKGMRWKHQGRGEGNPPRIDCAGLLVVTMKHFDLPCEDLKGYGRDPAPAFRRQIEKFTDPADHMGILHGAIGIFTDTVMPCHCGIFTTDQGEIRVLHAEAYPRRRVHEEAFDIAHPSLRDRLIGLRLFKEVDYLKES